MSTLKDALFGMYLDYLNDYLTVEKFADDYGIETEDAETLLLMASKYYQRSLVKE